MNWRALAKIAAIFVVIVGGLAAKTILERHVEQRNHARRLAAVVDVDCYTIHQQPEGQAVRMMGQVSTRLAMCGGSVNVSLASGVTSLDYERTMVVRGVKLTVFANTTIASAVNELPTAAAGSN